MLSVCGLELFALYFFDVLPHLLLCSALLLSKMLLFSLYLSEFLLCLPLLLYFHVAVNLRLPVDFLPYPLHLHFSPDIVFLSLFTRSGSCCPLRISLFVHVNVSDEVIVSALAIWVVQHIVSFLDENESVVERCLIFHLPQLTLAPLADGVRVVAEGKLPKLVLDLIHRSTPLQVEQLIQVSSGEWLLWVLPIVISI